VYLGILGKPLLFERSLLYYKALFPAFLYAQAQGGAMSFIEALTLTRPYSSVKLSRIPNSLLWLSLNIPPVLHRVSI